MSGKKSKKIPIFTTGDINVPSTKFVPNEDTIFVSSYTGKVLDSHPTFTTQTDDSTGKNPTYHGGLYIGNNKVVCHQSSYNNNSSQNNYYGGLSNYGGYNQYSFNPFSNYKYY